MGTISHDAIIVTGDEKAVAQAHELALGIALTFKEDGPMQSDWSLLISPVVGSVMNCYASFLVAPDGSKEFWSTSNAGDELRKLIVERLAGSDMVTVVEVKFGELGEEIRRV